MSQTSLLNFFTTNNTMFESACETNGKCDTDQQAFKSSYARALAVSVQLAPFLGKAITPKLQTSATAAAQSCVGDGNSTCGFQWTATGFDGLSGLGEELNALSIFQSLLIVNSAPVAEGAGAGIANGTATGTSNSTTASGTGASVSPTHTGNAGAISSPAATSLLVQVGLFALFFASLI
jgi:mannan endo-1,6-alpha-mannosidase